MVVFLGAMGFALYHYPHQTLKYVLDPLFGLVAEHSHPKTAKDYLDRVKYYATSMALKKTSNDSEGFKTIYKKAALDMEKAVELSPNNSRCYAVKAALNAMVDKYDDALEDIDKAIGLNPKNPVYYARKADYCFALKRYEDALVHYDVAIKMKNNVSPDFLPAFLPDAYHGRGETYAILGDEEKARVDFAEEKRQKARINAGPAQ